MVNAEIAELLREINAFEPLGVTRHYLHGAARRKISEAALLDGDVKRAEAELADLVLRRRAALFDATELIASAKKHQEA